VNFVSGTPGPPGPPGASDASILTTGGMLYGSAPSVAANLPIGTGVLSVSGGLPAWSNNPTLSMPALAATIVAGLTLLNPTAAISGTQQNSPAVVMTGQGFGTVGGSKSVAWAMYVQPTQGTSPDGTLTYAFSLNGGAYATRLALFGSGLMSVGNISFDGVPGNISTNNIYLNSFIIAGISQLNFLSNLGATTGSGHVFTNANVMAPSTSINQSAFVIGADGVGVPLSWAPTGGAPNFVGLHVNPEINGTSTGKGVVAAIVAKTATLAGGTVIVLDVGTSPTDYFDAGYVSRLKVDKLGTTSIATNTTSAVGYALGITHSNTGGAPALNINNTVGTTSIAITPGGGRAIDIQQNSTAATGINIQDNASPNGNNMLTLTRSGATSSGHVISITNAGTGDALHGVGALTIDGTTTLSIGPASATDVSVSRAAGKIGFYGHATVAQQTVLGSRATGAALADFLTKMANTGLIVDGSTA